MKKSLLALALALPILGFSQWKTANTSKLQVKEGKEIVKSSGIYDLNIELFKQQLINAPDRFSGQAGKILSLPNAEGKMEKFEVWEASNFTPVLQAKFPEIRSYVGVGIDDPTAYLRFSLSPSTGVSTMTLRAGKSEFIEPYTVDGNTYIVFDSKDHRKAGEIPFECSTPETNALVESSGDLASQNKSSAGVFKTLRLAQSVTGEYSTYFGGTLNGAMAGVNATLTRVNGIFERDFAVRLILIDNNDAVIYLDAGSDPYTSPSNIAVTQSQLHSTLTDVIGYDNFDIGHIFHRSGGGGNAGCIGCVCDAPSGNSKGKGTGYTSPGSGGPEGDNFDIDYVAHEMGHQLGANHTFSHGFEGTGANVEPGSGSTIMSYAGITSYNVQSHSDDYFTYKSIQQVQNNLQNKACVVNTPMTNSAPVVDAGGNFDIPKGTAFVLRGSATDAEGDPLVYNWEQLNSGTGNTTGSNSRVSLTKAVGPNFRSHPHETTPVRYMPKFEYVLTRDVADNESYWRGRWEAVTTVARVFNFTLTARDNHPGGGQTATAQMVVTVRDAGPFTITNPVSNQEVSLSNNAMLVEWDVAGTDAAPINTENVKISLSTDNGATFTVVAESTANDGSETITIPEGTVAGNNMRIMIEAVDNIYYAVSRPFKFTGTMGISEMNLSTVGVYPNPNNGQFYVKASNVAQGNVKTTIYDATGKLVHKQDNNHFGGALEQSYQVNLAAGVYVLNIETANGTTTHKLLIK